MALTDTWLKANNRKQIEKVKELADRDGLSIRLTLNGKITFQMRYRYDNRAKHLDLGSYPLMSLKEARSENLRLRAQLEQGFDPKVVRQLEKQTIIKADSIEELFRQWYYSYCVKHKKGHHDVQRSFELHVFPSLGHLPAAHVTIHEWLSLLEKRAEATPGIAERILTNAKQMYKWAIKRRLVPSNPLSDINAAEDLFIKPGVGDRSLDAAEICLVWTAIERSRMSHKNKLFVKLCLAFGCRNGEIRLSEKKHFDFKAKVWTIPSENHKLGKMTSKPLLRPLIPEVEALIKEAMLLSGPGKYLFNNSGSTKPMGKSAPGALPYNIMQWVRKHKGINMTHWSLHDLRKTARTNFSELTEPHIAEIMLGHKLPGTWQVYDHYDYLKEQAVCYSKWWAKLMDITGHNA